jgi:hypothetical protein
VVAGYWEVLWEVGVDAFVVVLQVGGFAVQDLACDVYAATEDGIHALSFWWAVVSLAQFMSHVICDPSPSLR